MKSSLGMMIIILVLTLPLGWAQRADNGVATGQLRGTGGAPAIGVRVAALAVSGTDPQGGGSLVSLAETGPDGRFRLENIPAGRYYIQAGFIDGPSYYPGVSSTSGATSVLVAAGATVTGLDFTMTRSAGIRISGRVPLTINPQPVSIRLLGGNTPMMGGPNTQQFGPDGSFEFLRVAPGNYSISVVPSNPLLPTVQLVVNDKDIQVGMPVGPGFKVSGNVGRGPQSPRPPNQRVVLTGSTAWSQLETPVNGSGEFEFASVPAGTYSLRTIPGSSSDVSRLTVVDREIRGFVLPAQVQLAGHVLLDDGTTLPLSSVALMIEAIRTDGVTFASAANREGTFKLPLNEGDYRIVPGRLPAGLSVKSISYGSSDILTNPIKLDGTSAPAEIRLLLQKRR